MIMEVHYGRFVKTTFLNIYVYCNPMQFAKYFISRGQPNSSWSSSGIFVFGLKFSLFIVCPPADIIPVKFFVSGIICLRKTLTRHRDDLGYIKLQISQICYHQFEHHYCISFLFRFRCSWRASSLRNKVVCYNLSNILMKSTNWLWTLWWSQYFSYTIQ